MNKTFHFIVFVCSMSCYGVLKICSHEKPVRIGIKGVKTGFPMAYKVYTSFFALFLFLMLVFAFPREWDMRIILLSVEAGLLWYALVAWKTQFFIVGNMIIKKGIVGEHSIDIHKVHEIAKCRMWNSYAIKCLGYKTIYLNFDVVGSKKIVDYISEVRGQAPEGDKSSSEELY